MGCSMIISEEQRKSRKYKQTTGNFSSCKMRTSVSYFSLLQKDFMYWLEFDADVVSYTTPPLQWNVTTMGNKNSTFLIFKSSATERDRLLKLNLKK